MRLAVGIILRRPAAGGGHAVLLVERRPELAFFGGYWAFAGGTVEEQDGAVRPAVATNGAGATTSRPEIAASAALAPPATAAGPALVTAAARELFEETGVLVARRADGSPPTLAPPDRERLRACLLAREARFADLLAHEGLAIDAARFVPACRMITPPFSLVRYDTLFFVVDLNDERDRDTGTGESESVPVLATELVRGEFLEPREALARWRAGEMRIVPPGILLLEILEGAESEAAWTAGERGTGSRAADPALPRFLEAARRLTAEYARGKIHRVRFTPGVQMATLRTGTHPPAHHTNAYLVGEERLFLVDPGSDIAEEHERLFELLDEEIARGRRLEAVLLTHHHPDHVGAVPAVVGRYGLPVWAHAETAAALAGRIAVARALAEGDAIPLGGSPDGRPGWSLAVLHTPGHAPGHLAFRESRYGALLVGDLVSTISTVVIAPPEGHLATYLASLRRLRTLPAATLYPAHGPARRDSHAVLDGYLAHRARREERVLAALGAELRPLEEILALAYDDVGPEALALARRSLLAGLAKLVEEGRAEERGGAYRLAGARAASGGAPRDAGPLDAWPDVGEPRTG